VRRLATTPALTSFVVGTVAGVLIMWFAGAHRPLVVVPSTAQAAIVQPPLAPPDVPAPVVQPAAEGNRSTSASRASSIVSTTARQVGTSGRGTRAPGTVTPSRVAPVRPAATRSPVAPVPPATPRNTAGVARGSYRGSLAFRSAPQGARVFVNGSFVGSTPLVLENLPVGSRAVRIEADGYQRWSASTQVVANQQTRVSATLGRAAP